MAMFMMRALPGLSARFNPHAEVLNSIIERLCAAVHQPRRKSLGRVVQVIYVWLTTCVTLVRSLGGRARMKRVEMFAGIPED